MKLLLLERARAQPLTSVAGPISFGYREIAIGLGPAFGRESLHFSFEGILSMTCLSRTLVGLRRCDDPLCNSGQGQARAALTSAVVKGQSGPATGSNGCNEGRGVQSPTRDNSADEGECARAKLNAVLNQRIDCNSCPGAPHERSCPRDVVTGSRS